MEKIKIRFRPMNEEDFDQIALWLEDFQDVAMFDRALPVPVGKGFVSGSWKPALEVADPPTSFWFFVEINDGAPIGMCGLQAINYIHGDAVMPLFVAQGYRSKGLAAAMILMLGDLAFDQLRLHRLSTLYRADNEASGQLTKLAGFTVEGRIREGWYADGQRYDIVKVGTLKSEWKENREALEKRLATSSFNVINGAAAPT